MKKLYLIILCMLLTISVFALPASAVDYDSDGHLVFTGGTFGTYSNFADSSATPVTDSNHQVPSNYHLVGYYYVCAWSNRSTCSWIYAPDSVTEMTAYLDSSSRPFWSKIPNQDSFYVLTNNFFSDNTQALITTQSGSYNSQTTSQNSQLTIFIPCLDSEGNIVRPEPDINFNLNAGYNDTTFDLSFTASSNSYFSDFVDFYLFPSSISLPTDQTNFVTNEYVTEIPLSETALITKYGLVKLLVGEWATTGGVVPRLTFVSRSSSSRYISQTFDPSSFGVPFALLGYRHLHDSSNTDVYITDTLNINLKSINQSHSGVYSYNDLCVVAVVRDSDSGRVYTSRFDFSRSNLLNSSVGVVPPSQTDTPDSYTGGTVNDLQDLADYLQYLYTTNDHNQSILDNNMIAYLQSIDWSGYMANGVAAGMANFLPKLSAELDTIFNGLFDDFFVPDLDDIKEQVEADEEEFSDKFQWVHDIKAEIHFITTTPLSAGDDEFVFHTYINKWGVGDVTFFDSDWIDSSTRTALKTIISVFCTIALVFYIFKTLPSTLGNMPTD